MKKSYLFILLITVLVFSACEKEHDEVSLTKEALLGTYKLVAITRTIGSSGEIDITDEYVEECQKDDLSEFKSDMTLVTKDVGILCSPQTNEEVEWELKGTNKLIIDGDEYKVTKWDGRNLNYSYSDIRDGQKVVETFKLSKQ